MKNKRNLNFTSKQFINDLYAKVTKDDIFTGAAALTFYLLLALFPAMIFLLSLLPYLPVPNLNSTIMNIIADFLPKQSAELFTGVIQEVTTERSSGLISFGFIAAIWAASTGMHAIMRQLNNTYGVKEARSFIRGRGVAILLTFTFGLLIIGAFSLILLGDFLQFSKAARWVIIFSLMLLGFSLIYYFGLNLKQKFRFITIGSMLGVSLLVIASLLFRLYIENFADYAATYGSLGAVIVLMLWIYIAGVVLLLGSEVNALIESYRKP